MIVDSFMKKPDFDEIFFPSLRFSHTVSLQAISTFQVHDYFYFLCKECFKPKEKKQKQ